MAIDGITSEGLSSGACGWSYCHYETYVVDSLIRKGLSGSRLRHLLDLHTDRIKNHYKASFLPEACINLLMEIDAVIHANWADPRETNASDKPELHESFKRAMRAAARNGMTGICDDTEYGR